MSDPKVKRWVGKYEVGKTIVQGTFAKLRYAKDTETGEPVALKILDKDKLLNTNMSELVKKNSLSLFSLLLLNQNMLNIKSEVHMLTCLQYTSLMCLFCVFAFVDKDRNLYNDADKPSKCSAAV